MTSSSLPAWPPELTSTQRDELAFLAQTYALSNGLAYLPLPSKTVNNDANINNAHEKIAQNAPAPIPIPAIHAPFSLFPTPFPRKLFYEAKRLQRLYHVLYARIAMDDEFLDRAIGGVASVDSFVGQLWHMWKKIRDDSIREQWHLGIFRSDYLLHDSTQPNEEIALKQVEFNTISVSFGALSSRVSRLHRYLLSKTGYFGSSEHLKMENLPENQALEDVVGGLVAAHRAYGVNGAYILFVVQPDERNVFDQRLIEYELCEKYSIRVIRQSFDQLLRSSSLSSDRTLYLSGTICDLPEGDKAEISVIYFRTGYTVTDYAEQAHYDLRELLSRSRAISCPTLALQLAGSKKIQQILTLPGILERFLPPSDVKPTQAKEYNNRHADPFGPEKFTQEDLSAIRATWVQMWGLEEQDGVSRTLARASSLVLKPQREGGGNNIYRSLITPFITAIPEQELSAWIAMELIEPPYGVGGYLLQAGTGKARKASEVVSELGIFGWALFRSGEVGRKQRVEESSGGWLVRTKGRESDEGGVAVGFSVLDSVVLVN